MRQRGCNPPAVMMVGCAHLTKNLLIKRTSGEWEAGVADMPARCNSVLKSVSFKAQQSVWKTHG